MGTKEQMNSIEGSVSASLVLIDEEDLLMALENGGYEMEYFLDLQTGAIVLRGDEASVGKDEDLEKQLENEPDRFRYIIPVQSSVSWRIMAEYVEQLPSGRSQTQMARALHGSHPFRQFKNSLRDHPVLREQWFAFNRERMLELARDWLRDEGIDAQLKTNQ